MLRHEQGTLSQRGCTQGEKVAPSSDLKVKIRTNSLKVEKDLVECATWLKAAGVVYLFLA